MTHTIKFKRGKKADLPSLSCGEAAFSIDTEEIFIGSNNGNIQLTKHSKPVFITLSDHLWAGKSAPYSYTISDPDITATNIIDISFRSGVTKEVADAWGAANIKRYDQFDGELILYADSERPTIDIPLHMIISGLSSFESSGGGGTVKPPANVTNFTATAQNKSVLLKWSDPIDPIDNNGIWAGTRIIRKEGSYPQDELDGTVVVTNVIRNQYAVEGFTDSGLENGKTYYYHAFPYTAEGAVNRNAENRISVYLYKIMTVKIDLSNSNPATCCSYADDAVNMIPGSAEWDIFFEHKPCLFKNGAVVGYLNPNNFAQFADGSAADITSGNAGDVMIEFPRRGLIINTVGNVMTVSMTQATDSPDFDYLAHSRGNAQKDNFYLGTYKGYVLNSKLRSLSSKTLTVKNPLAASRASAHANGIGYENNGFYQNVFRIAMYLLKYKNLNSQSVIGRGYVDGNTAALSAGGTETKGMDWGEATGKQHMKLFGLEDYWGNICEWIDGAVTDANMNLLTATDNFNDSGSGYSNQGQIATSDISGYVSKVTGTTRTGFVAREVNGSATTYFCNHSTVKKSSVSLSGGMWSDASYAGAFSLHVLMGTGIETWDNIGSRLMYL